MQKQEIKQEKMSTDVLIIGGGIAGLTAAISVKKKSGYQCSGCGKQNLRLFRKANKGGGVLQYLIWKNNTGDVQRISCKRSRWLSGKPEPAEKYVAMNNELLDKMESWGSIYPKNVFRQADDLHGWCGSGSYVKNENNCHKTGRKIYR